MFLRSNRIPPTNISGICENHVKSFNFRAHHLLLSTMNRLSREKFTQIRPQQHCRRSPNRQPGEALRRHRRPGTRVARLARVSCVGIIDQRSPAEPGEALPDRQS
ncbi:hypothetical protein KSP40_PGU005178 [Platanthera guangdongensis]|uniref:Uncharacterized protein n=1 Tax=Platanthera guangdongensis TaxID=2320717 RepID=A0ABR2MYC8_9ASPA